MRKLPKNLTGLDLLLICTLPGAPGQSTDLDAEAAHVFQSLCADATGAGLASEIELADIATRPLSVTEETASRIVGLAVQLARARGTEEMIKEVLTMGIPLAMRFGEYAETFLPGEPERQRRLQDTLDKVAQIQADTGDLADWPRDL